MPGINTKILKTYCSHEWEQNKRDGEGKTQQRLSNVIFCFLSSVCINLNCNQVYDVLIFLLKVYNMNIYVWYFWKTWLLLSALFLQDFFLEANVFLVRYDRLMIYQVLKTKDLNSFKYPEKRRGKRLFVGKKTNLKTILITEHRNEVHRSYQLPLSEFYCGHLHYKVTRNVINAKYKRS